MFFASMVALPVTIIKLNKIEKEEEEIRNEEIENYLSNRSENYLSNRSNVGASWYFGSEYWCSNCFE